jgi:ABC-type glycerol-3-phosphate transport system permease component
MILAIIAAWMAYKKAKVTGRNPILWAFIAVATFVVTQLIVSVGAGLALGLGIATLGWSENVFETYNLPITILAIITSFMTLWLVLRYLDKVPDEPVFAAPPPPSNFDIKE